MFTRRDLIRYSSFGALTALAPGFGFAGAGRDARFVLVILRGGVDGLALAAPYGDGNYRKQRGELALDAGEVLQLDGLFGLHPSLANVGSMYEKNEALLVHAAASPYRERSHFDGPDVLENGAAKVGALRDGWLNRAVGPLGGALGDERAIALSQNTPLVLRGDNSVTSWAPSQMPQADDDILERLQTLYANDEFFATRLAQALESQEIAGNMNSVRRRQRGNDAAQTRAMMQAAGKFLTAADGPRIAVLEAGGWDTHANQGAATGALANRLRGLDEGLAELERSLGSAWAETVVAVVTEFGRTVKVNGTRGTDHGTATAALLLGGAVDGGRITADWPGLASNDLYQGRDLKPTADLRSVFKGILIDHLGITEGYVEDVVFPESRTAIPTDGLIRA